MSTITTVSCDPIATSPRSGAKPSAVQDRKRSGKSKARTTRSDRVVGGRKRVDASKRAATGTVASKRTLRRPSSKERHKVHRSSQSSPHPIRRARDSVDAQPGLLEQAVQHAPAEGAVAVLVNAAACWLIQVPACARLFSALQ